MSLWAADSSAGRWAGHLFCRSRTTLPSPCLSRLIQIPPRKGRTVGSFQMFCQNMFTNLSLLSEARGERACGWGRAATCFHVGWSFGMQWQQALVQAGFGGPVGLPIIYGASLREVLEHILGPPFNLMLGFGSRNDSKSFGSNPKR